jgi:hypothetical protein
MNPLKIEVTEAMLDAAARAMFDRHSQNQGGVDSDKAHLEYAKRCLRKAYEDDATAALTAAFQHPEFVRQIREQVGACVPEEEHEGRSDTFPYGFDDSAPGYNRAITDTRASLGRLLGEEGP